MRKRVVFVPKLCPKCGIAIPRKGWFFKASAYARKKFCSERCYRDSQVRTFEDKKCAWCGKMYNRWEARKRCSAFARSKFCSAACAGKFGGAGLRRKNWILNGYIFHPHKGKIVSEHRIIAERILGRSLKTGEVVHHVNGDRKDNRHCNLLICSRSYHNWIHYRMADLYMAEHFQRAGHIEPLAVGVPRVIA